MLLGVNDGKYLRTVVRSYLIGEMMFLRTFLHFVGDFLGFMLSSDSSEFELSL